jgi:hypothetical protein
MLEERQNRFPHSILKDSVGYHIKYVLKIIRTIPEAYPKTPDNVKALNQLVRWGSLPPEADRCTWGMLMAYAAAYTHEASLVIMNYPPMIAIALGWVLAELRGLPTSESKGASRFESFLRTYNTIFFFNGYPKTINDYNLSRKNWLTVSSEKYESMQRISNARTGRLKSSMRTLEENGFNIKSLTPIDLHNNIEEQCDYLIKRIQNREQLIPDVLQMHVALPQQVLKEIAYGRFKGSIKPLIADILETFGRKDHWSAPHAHFENRPVDANRVRT